jgi:hypothetical protein
MRHMLIVIEKSKIYQPQNEKIENIFIAYRMMDCSGTLDKKKESHNDSFSLACKER